jgi:hypothetical protein
MFGRRVSGGGAARKPLWEVSAWSNLPSRFKLEVHRSMPVRADACTVLYWYSAAEALCLYWSDTLWASAAIRSGPSVETLGVDLEAGCVCKP